MIPWTSPSLVWVVRALSQRGGAVMSYVRVMGGPALGPLILEN
ncbi:hypothetical protein DFAR_1860007 [Desulfarculales bacterium]